MSSSRSNFDPIGIVIDWLDACRARQLLTLIDLYDNEASIDCCQGGTFRGRLGLERYWRPKLTHAVTGAFEVDALFPEADGVCLDYRDFDGTPVRTNFTFTVHGKNSLYCLRHNKTGCLAGSSRFDVSLCDDASQSGRRDHQRPSERGAGLS